MADHQYTLAELAELLSVKYVGDAELVVSGLATLASAGPGQLGFLPIKSDVKKRWQRLVQRRLLWLLIWTVSDQPTV